MNSITTSTEHIAHTDIEQLAFIAARGFSRTNDHDNYSDTAVHCKEADDIQVATIDGTVVGFALYRRLLWR